MTVMVWDETGARYFETGVSHGILFDMQGVGVPWNGLVNVAIDPTGGELESYYYDGLKYADRILAEDFQATIQAITTPKEFDSCEGVREVVPGMRTHFNKRSKFNLAWKTIIGNDLNPELAYKWHIAYNCTVQPASRAYATLSEATTPDIRSFVVTTTPACGRHSYYSFDSRDVDLSDLEALLTTGVLPKCYELKDLASADGGGSDDICRAFLEDYEEYVHGEIVDETKTVPNGFEVTIEGQINNGLDVVELPAVGAFAANDSAASEVGTGDILADDDDATYITSDDGDLGYTVGLPPLVGYVEGCIFELRIRASISGGVNEDDPENMDADMQVHICTDDTGDLNIGGFSDGADEGMGFALSLVDGTPVDYVIPLSMDAWINTHLEDVVAALEVGAYLNVVGATNNNTDTTPEVRVYEAKIVMLDPTDGSKSLRALSPDDGDGVSYTIINSLSVYAAFTMTTHFKFKSAKFYSGLADDSLEMLAWPGASEAGVVTADVFSELPRLQWDVLGSSIIVEFVEVNKWYVLKADWRDNAMTLSVHGLEDPTDVVFVSSSIDTDISIPSAVMELRGGWIEDDDLAYELWIDNAEITVYCEELETGA